MKSCSPGALGRALCAASLLLAGCESDPPLPPAPAVGGMPGVDSSGQTGSPGSGAVECTQHEECRARLEEQARSLAQPALQSRSFSVSRCEPVSLIAGNESRSGAACICVSADGTSQNVGPQGGDCQVRGRTGRCLWESFEGCIIEDRDSCKQTCADLEQRLHEDAARANEVKLEHFACKGYCEGVLRVDGRCVPASAIGSGRSYDCALGAPAVLAAEARYLDAERQAMQPPVPQSGAWQRPDRDENGTLGYVELAVISESWGSYARAPQFFAAAQFFRLEPPGDDDAVVGEILDPLVGLDDCGVLRLPPGIGLGFGFTTDYFQVGSASISVEGESVPVAPTSANHANFSSYSADFSGREPRFGASYQFSAQGGELPGPLSLSLTLPEQLRIESLERVSHVPRGALALRWTGKGSAALHVLLRVDAGARGYELECRLRDDGAFTIPEALLSLLPDGVATATITREVRIVPKAGSTNVLGWAYTQVMHNFAFGATCDSAAASRACLELAAKRDAVSAECGLDNREEVRALCPEYLAQACGVCARTYTCQIEQTRCLHPGISLGFGCACETLVGGPNGGVMRVPEPGI